MITGIKKLKFVAGHQVVEHGKESLSFHVHEYYLELFVQSQKLDNNGKGKDFLIVKDRVEAWINEYWDHTTIIWKEDPGFDLFFIRGKKEPYITLFNPTTKNLADFLLSQVCPYILDHTGIIINKIRLYETPNYYEEVSL